MENNLLTPKEMFDRISKEYAASKGEIPDDKELDGWPATVLAYQLLDLYFNYQAINDHTLNRIVQLGLEVYNGLRISQLPEALNLTKYALNDFD